MSDVINIGVVGAGYWGPNLIRNFSAIPGFNVKYVCDKDPKRLGHMKELFRSIEPVTDYDLLVGDNDLDAIAVATPVSLHHGLAKKSLEAGKHTFIEKPMTASVAESEELIDIADRKGLTLMVGHTFIYTSAVRKIKEIVKSEDFGELYYISSRRLNLGLFQKDINVAWDLAPHDISIVLYLMDRPPVSVNCQGKAHVTSGIEDITNLSMNFERSGFAMIQSSWLDPNKIREMTIVGSKQMVVYDDMEPLEKIKIYDKRVEVPPHYDTFAEFQYSYHYGDVLAPFVKQTEPLRVECQHFLDCINSGEKPESDGRDGLNVIKILEASSHSLKKEGAMVSID